MPVLLSTDGQDEVSSSASDFDDEDDGTKSLGGQSEDRGENKPGIGLLNLGFTCYVNATVQCLAHLDPFCSALEQSKLAAKSEKHAPSASALRQVVRGVHSVSTIKKPFVPRKLLARLPRIAPQLSHLRQEDAHEFLTALLDSLSQGFADKLVQDCFAGKLRSTLACPDCGYESHNTESFVDLSIEVQSRDNKITSSFFHKDKTKSYQNGATIKSTYKTRRLRQQQNKDHQSVHSTVDVALAEFFKIETLDGDNAWACSQCGRRVCATKRLTLEQAPARCLVVHLKRFQMSFLDAYPRQRKISSHVGFGPMLQLPGTEQSYELSAVLVHEGATTRSGHYSAYIRHKGQWFLFDDDLVQGPLNPDYVFRQQAYLLFYTAHSTFNTISIVAPPPPIIRRSNITSFLSWSSGTHDMALFLKHRRVRRRWRLSISLFPKTKKRQVATKTTSATEHTLTKKEDALITTPAFWNNAFSNIATWEDKKDEPVTSMKKRKIGKNDYRYDSWDQALDEPRQRKKKKKADSHASYPLGQQTEMKKQNPFELFSRRKGFV
uniref:USP domain-containing protein n=1 Tax=Aureoumbra lagunensis TaxID=44058 RepID=A0A7S3K6C8_9STRA